MWRASPLLQSPVAGAVLVSSIDDRWVPVAYQGLTVAKKVMGDSACFIWSNLTAEGDVAVQAINRDGSVHSEQYIPLGVGRNYANFVLPSSPSDDCAIRIIAITNLAGPIQCSIVQ